MLGWRLPSLSRPSLRRVLSTAAEGVKGAEGAQGPPGQATIRRAAYEIIRTAPGPIRTRNVVEALKQQPLVSKLHGLCGEDVARFRSCPGLIHRMSVLVVKPPDQMALLSMTHLKKRILKSMKEAEQIR